MRLYSYCSICKNQVKIKSIHKDRLSLAKNDGEVLEVKCGSCGNLDQIHVNNFFAKESIFAILIASLIFVGVILGVIFYVLDLFNRFGKTPITNLLILELFGVIAIPSLIYFVIRGEERKRVRIFNSFRV